MDFSKYTKDYIFSKYKGNLKWLEENTIFLTVAGSHSYGTSTPTSDVDIRGLAIAPKNVYLGLDNFEQASGSWEEDCVITELRKFISLAQDCNPNIIELLFTDERNILFASPIFDMLRANKDLFISKKARYTFSGYAVSQLKRIETHKGWLMKGELTPPQRADFDLPDDPIMSNQDQLQAAHSAVKGVIDSWQLDLDGIEESTILKIKENVENYLVQLKLYSEEDRVAVAARTLGYSDDFIEYIKKEKKYKIACNQYKQWQTWKSERNKARAALEEKYGYDTKHASHLIRLLNMAIEILSGEGVKVYRPDHDLLTAIRGGAWDYDKLMVETSEKMKKVVELYPTSALPYSADKNKIDHLCQRLISNFYGWV